MFGEDEPSQHFESGANCEQDKEDSFSNVQLPSKRSHQYAHLFDNSPLKEAIEKFPVISIRKVSMKTLPSQRAVFDNGHSNA